MTSNTDWEKEFDDKFTEKEGCRASVHSDDCKYCAVWGGKEGEPKDWKRAKGSSREIKDFIRTQLSIAREEGARSAVEYIRENTFTNYAIYSVYPIILKEALTAYKK